MKFKTVSEFIHALEVEGKKFINPSDPEKYFIEWREGYLQEIPFDPNGQSFRYDVHDADFTLDWQEYRPEKVKRWVNLYWGENPGRADVYGYAYETKAMADEARSEELKFIACVEIEVEE